VSSVGGALASGSEPTSFTKSSCGGPPRRRAV